MNERACPTHEPLCHECGDTGVVNYRQECCGQYEPGCCGAIQMDGCCGGFNCGGPTPVCCGRYREALDLCPRCNGGGL